MQESLGRGIIDEDTKYIEEYLTKTEHKELNRSILEEFAQENKYIADDMLTLTRDKIRDIIETLKS
ncbi:MAG: hypothetical protein UHN59_00515 [Bacteroidales bacterium]|nr:hypothetical protein [Bacteroidales bacterium]